MGTPQTWEKRNRKMHRGKGPSIDQKQLRDEHQPFVFLGGDLALDLVNTEIIVRGKNTDLLVTHHDAIQWWEEARQVYPHLIQNLNREGCSEQEVVMLRALRRTLRQLFEALVAQRPIDEEDVKALNEVLQEGYYALKISSEGKASAHYTTRNDAGTPAPLLIAFAALSLLMDLDQSRLHACQNEQCTLLFYDRTKSATRQWCNTACMNRARSRKNYRQAKEAPPPRRDALTHEKNIQLSPRK
jgi:predicted RNA-binding Zn ribbon-like protein